MELVRTNRGFVAAAEKRALLWLAKRIPSRIHSDHLTLLGFVSLVCVGASYWLARFSRLGLVLVILFMALNWFGDSLDGTLARVRNRQRPRYGFYIDHVLDACGSMFLFAGLALSGYMSERIAVGLLAAYFLLSIEVCLATYALGEFKLSFAAFGPTELRLLLIVGNIAAWNKKLVLLGGHQFLLFDVGGAIGIAGMIIAFLWTIARNITHLYRAEPLKL